ncbi:MAG: hypothetical protein LBJ04_04200 [Sphingobacterium sp.]|jgi:hypothetical protein|nr:hypothetical protein [Sphingobacterium sp.]
MKEQFKKNYVAPKIEVFSIELEQGIAAGSQVDNTVQQQFQQGDDDSREQAWF